MKYQEFLTPKATVPDLREPATMNVEAFLHWARINRFLFHQEVKRGRIRPKKCSGRTIVPVQEAERWLQELPDLISTAQPDEG